MFLFKVIFCILLQVLCNTRADDTFTTGSVYYSPWSGLYLTPNVLDKENSLAYGSFNDTTESVGWGILNIKAGYGTYTNLVTNNLIMEAAGILEGYLTANRIQQNAANIYDYFFVQSITNNQTKSNIINFINQQDTWMREQIAKNNDPLWRHVSYIVSQYDGLMEGYYNAAADNNNLRKLTKLDFDLINDAGDLLDLEDALNPSGRPDFTKMTKDELDEYLLKRTHCSVLIKLLPGYENIFMSHSTWFTYQSMLRIYKHYDFNLNDPNTISKGVSFSSYPGMLSSWDDFYMMSNNLVMLQTTNEIFNKTLYDLYVKPQSLFAWHRVRIANMVASNGKEWSNTIAFFNSGTYNNQYMIIDLNKITLNQTIEDDALWVSEQIPGLVVFDDQTDILRAGYWASYNVPFYEQIYNMSGYPDIVKTRGPEYTYALAPRAKIFRRDQGQVSDMESMMKMMRYNNYKNDIYSDGNACKTICCRGDITSKSSNGCTDTKITDYTNAMFRNAQIINGPTTDNGLPPFSWNEFESKAHEGMPDTFNFQFIATHPEL